jgi:hypothetical protein
LATLSTSKAERFLRRRRKSRVSNHSQQTSQKKKSLSKEYNPKGCPLLQARKKSTREGALIKILRGKLKKLLSLRYLKNHNKLPSKNDRARQSRIICFSKAKSSKIN